MSWARCAEDIADPRVSNKAGDNLGTAEELVETQRHAIDDLKRKVRLRAWGRADRQIEDLTPRAEEATRLADLVDEYKHSAERAKKSEAVLEKYKRKLEDLATLHRQVKVRLLGTIHRQG